MKDLEATIQHKTSFSILYDHNVHMQPLQEKVELAPSQLFLFKASQGYTL